MLDVHMEDFEVVVSVKEGKTDQGKKNTNTDTKILAHMAES
jgi:hypothetical protein